MGGNICLYEKRFFNNLALHYGKQNLRSCGPW